MTRHLAWAVAVALLIAIPPLAAGGAAAPTIHPVSVDDLPLRVARAADAAAEGDAASAARAAPVTVVSPDYENPVQWVQPDSGDATPREKTALDAFGASVPVCESTCGTHERLLPPSRSVAPSPAFSVPGASSPPPGEPRETASSPRVDTLAARAGMPPDGSGRTPHHTAVAAAAGVLAVALAALYSRLGAAALLRSPARQRILDVLRTRSGLTESEVAQALGVQRTTARYHLRLLRAAGAVASVRVRSRDRYYAVGDPAAAATAKSNTLTALPSVAALLAAVAARPGVPLAEAARAAGLSRQLAHAHVRPLAEAGLVRLHRASNGRLHCYPPPAGT